MCVYVYVCLLDLSVYRVCRACRGQKSTSEPLELDTQVTVRGLMWVLVVKPGSYARALRVLHCRAVSTAQLHYSFDARIVAPCDQRASSWWLLCPLGTALSSMSWSFLSGHLQRSVSPPCHSTELKASAPLKGKLFLEAETCTWGNLWWLWCHCLPVLWIDRHTDTCTHTSIYSFIIYLSVCHPRIYPFVYLWIYLSNYSFHPLIYPYIYLFFLPFILHTPIYPSVYLHIHLSIHPPMCHLSIHLSIYLWIHPSISQPSIHPCVCLFIHLSICLSSIHLCIYVSIHSPIH